MSPSLEPGCTVAHFRIVALLGEGGMGEVYEAWDTELERRVALKVLPPDRLRDEERVGRFVKEARAASALAHANIVTVYEIGNDAVEGRDDGPTMEVRYIAMELVDGETLQRLIHERRADLETLLGYLAQAASGIARAHEAGVVHRDLKPENVMVTRDGCAKVLDFGLAKLDPLADRGDEGMSAAADDATAATADGVMLGTVGYMSPEQAKGRAVDHRSDVFSFGCILYEAATRQRPFVADSAIEVLQKIVHDAPPPMEELNPNVPAAVRRLVTRCMAKDPERRVQSMKDLALELGELVAEFDSLAPSSSSGVSRAGRPAPRLDPGRSSRWRWPALAAAVLVVVAGGWWLALRGGAPDDRTSPAVERDAFREMKIEPLTAEGTIALGALSPDGRYLAHTRFHDGLAGLWIRQVATGSQVEVVPPANLAILGVNFTPDGDYLYFVRSEPGRSGFAALYRVPALGGEPRQIAFDVDAGVTFSPDGSRIAFPRSLPQENRSTIVVGDADGAQLAELVSLELPDRFPRVRAAWSPSGETIVVFMASAADPLLLRLMEIDVALGEMRELPGGHGFTAVAGADWLPDGSGLVVVGRRRIVESGDQIWLIEQPSGELRRISNDVNDYGSPSVSADGSTLATVMTEAVSHLWAVPAGAPEEARQLTRARREIALDVVAGADGTAVLVRRQGSRLGLWRATAEGEMQQLTTEGLVFDPTLSADGRVLLASLIADEPTPHVWRFDPASGTPLEQLTDGRGEVRAAVSPDGSWFFYNEIGSLVLWRQALGGGEPEQIAPHGERGQISPDGRLLVYSSFVEVDGQAQPILTVATTDGEVQQRLRWDLERFFFHPDGDALVVHRTRNGVGNLWKRPLDGSAETQLTHFDHSFIFDADWSPDGEWLFVTRGETTSDVVLVRDFRP